MLSNLEFFVKVFGWQGGTIHQVSEELRRVKLSRELTSIDSLLVMNENAREVLATLYKSKLV